jgi:hypothetical protein
MRKWKSSLKPNILLFRLISITMLFNTDIAFFTGSPPPVSKAEKNL